MFTSPPANPNFSEDIDYDFQESPPNEKAVLLAAEIFKKHGFHTAIQEYGNKAALDRLIAETIAEVEVRKQAIQNRFQKKIEWHESQVAELKARLEQIQGKQDVFNRLEEIRCELLKTFRELGEAKRELLKNRMDDWGAETKMLFEIENAAYDDWWAISEKAFNHNEKRLKIIREQVDELRKKYIARHNEVDGQIAHLDKGGIDTSAYRYLLGTGMALVAGWFFSVFLLILNDIGTNGNADKSFGKEDVWFFLIKGILNALSDTPFYAVLQVLGFLILLGAVAWGCQWLLQKFDAKKNALTMAFDLDNESTATAEEVTESLKRRFRLKLTSDSIFALFLYAAPVLLVLGLLFVMLKSGVEPADVDKLDLSLIGQLVGTAIAFGVAGIVLLFLSKITDLKKAGWVNYVVIGGTLLFPLVLLWQEPQQRAIFGFVFAVSVAAVTMAFGIRYRGLHKLAIELEEAIGVCTQIIARYSSPIPVGIHSNAFRLTFKHMQSDMLDWMKAKNEGIHKMQESPGAVFTEKGPRRWQRFKNWLNRINQRPAVSRSSSDELWADERIPSQIRGLELDAYEKQYFPEFDKKITAHKFEYEEIRLQSQAMARRQTDLESKIEEQKKHVFDLQKNQAYALRIAHRQSVEYQNWIFEGFELGLWYLKNGLFPQRDPLPLYIDLPPRPEPVRTSPALPLPPETGFDEPSQETQPDTTTPPENDTPAPEPETTPDNQNTDGLPTAPETATDENDNLTSNPS